MTLSISTASRMGKARCTTWISRSGKTVTSLSTATLIERPRGSKAEFLIADSQKMSSFPGGSYDLIHIDGQQDGKGTLHDLDLALGQGRYILVDGYFWTREKKT